MKSPHPYATAAAHLNAATGSIQRAVDAHELNRAEADLNRATK